MYRNKLNSNVFDKYFNFTEYTNDFLEKTSLQIGGSESSDSDSISESSNKSLLNKPSDKQNITNQSSESNQSN